MLSWSLLEKEIATLNPFLLHQKSRRKIKSFYFPLFDYGKIYDQKKKLKRKRENVCILCSLEEKTSLLFHKVDK